MSNSFESLRSALALMPPGTLVPRDWLLEELSGAVVTQTASSELVDFTIRDLAKMFGKRPSTVRAWVERGDFAGAYKLHGKEWRIPGEGVKQFQQQQRARKHVD